VKKPGAFFVSRLVTGVLVVTPIYLACLLLLKVTKSLLNVLRPLKLLPKWLPAAHVVDLLLVLFVFFLIGLVVQTPKGRAAWERVENSLFRSIPGYEIFRSLTHRLAGETQELAWRPAMAEIEEALVPAFIIEELEDGRFTVFVPSAPTPVTGAVYILSPDRVHPLNVPFTHIFKTVSQWGSGSQALIAAMERTDTPSSHTTRDGVRRVR
jgi:uncharacterized membrane protein